MTQKLTFSTLLVAALLASIASLGIALVSEHVYGLKPCELCLFQRVPYVLVILFSILGLVKKRLGYALCMVVTLLFFVDSGIASYHTAVEKHWIAGPEACTDAASNAPMTVEQILAKIKGAPIVACDQPQWEFHGITMAMLNAFWALALTLAMFVATHHIRKRNAHA